MPSVTPVCPFLVYSKVLDVELVLSCSHPRLHLTVDGKGPINAKERRRTSLKAPGVLPRQSVNQVRRVSFCKMIMQRHEC